jgi:hypothetical protein
LSKILEGIQDRLHCLRFWAPQNVYEKGMRSYVSVGMRVGNGQNIATTPTRAQYFGPYLFLVPVIVLDILDKYRKFLIFFPICQANKEQNGSFVSFSGPWSANMLDKGRKFLLFFNMVSGLANI